MAVTEGELQKATLDLARLLGWRIARFPMLNLTADRKPRKLSYDTAGFPDVLLFREYVLGVEFKSSIGKISEKQLEWSRTFDRARLAWACWTPKDWDSGEIQLVLSTRLEAAA